MTPRLSKNIERELESCGLPWSIENGGRHWKLKVNGRLAAILPYGNTLRHPPDRSERNTIAQIRRVVRGIKP